MSFIGNVIWFLFYGFWAGLAWYLIGLLWCVTIVGIPVGIQCFKFGSLTFAPFGREIVYSTRVGSFLLNVLWLIFGGIPLALTNLVAGFLWCLTIVGIPFGLQCFKLARLSLLPFGAEIVRNNY